MNIVGMFWKFSKS